MDSLQSAGPLETEIAQAGGVDEHLPWCALYTSPRHEKRVAQHLAQRQFDCFLPLYSSERRWADGSRISLELPLFPSYLFVRIQREERSSVLSVPGAVRVVRGSGGELAQLSNETVEALRAALKLGLVEPHAPIHAGQRVRICAGPLAGFDGIVARNKKNLRVVMMVEHIMQSFAVEVALENLELIGEGQNQLMSPSRTAQMHSVQSTQQIHF